MSLTSPSPAAAPHDTKKEDSSPCGTQGPDVEPSQGAASGTAPEYKFVTFGGNHPENVRSALVRRGNFAEVPALRDIVG